MKKTALFIAYYLIASTAVRADILMDYIIGRDQSNVAIKSRQLVYREGDEILRATCPSDIENPSRIACNRKWLVSLSNTKAKETILKGINIGRAEMLEAAATLVADIKLSSQKLEDILSSDEENSAEIKKVREELNSLQSLYLSSEESIKKLQDDILELQNDITLHPDDVELQRQLQKSQTKYLSLLDTRIKIVADLTNLQRKFQEVSTSISDPLTFKVVTNQRDVSLKKYNEILGKLAKMERASQGVERVFKYLLDSYVYRAPFAGDELKDEQSAIYSVFKMANSSYLANREPKPESFNKIDCWWANGNGTNVRCMNRGFAPFASDAQDVPFNFQSYFEWVSKLAYADRGMQVFQWKLLSINSESSFAKTLFENNGSMSYRDIYNLQNQDSSVQCSCSGGINCPSDSLLPNASISPKDFSCRFPVKTTGKLFL